MSESTIDMDRAMQGIDCEAISWTKCSERMPPDDMDVIINSKDGIDQYGSGPRIRHGSTINVLCSNDSAYRLNMLDNKWTIYTPETWAELNKK